MFTCYRISDVEYYLEESEKARGFQAGEHLKAAEEALAKGDLEEAARALPQMADAILVGDKETAKAHIRDLRKELSASSRALKADDRGESVRRLEGVEAALGIVHDPEAHKRDSAAYYLDNGAGEDKGTWWSPTNGQVMPLVDRGAEVDARAFRAMARGCDPRTGEPLIQQTREERTAGYDCQFAAPKSVSALWATATPEMRARIEQMHRAAVHRALDFSQQEGLIITRRGKGGAEKEAVQDCAVAEFMHTTSRAGDPQLHSHGVLLNVCIRADGSTGSLDNHRILQYQGAMGAMYRAELAASLERELGLAISKDERNFKVNGVPEEVTQLWSKRREAIENAAEAAGYTTASDRERARFVAVDTRDKKADVPDREELEKRWTREVQSIGWSPAAIWDCARAARARSDQINAEHDIDPDTWKASERRRASKAATVALEANNAVLERRHVLREVTERMQGIGPADEAMEEVIRMVLAAEPYERAVLARSKAAQELADLRRMQVAPDLVEAVQTKLQASEKAVAAAVAEATAQGVLVHVGTLEAEDEPVYATPALIECERRLLRGALERKGEREFVPAAKVEAAIAKRSTMSEEQAAAVRHALNRDGVAVVEGSAGTGKSFSLGGVADAARDAGLHVYVVAPSHKAKDVIRHDTTTDEDSAKAVQGFNSRIANERHKDHIALTASDCIIVDEAGMVGTREMETLLRHAKDAGCKVILAGDTRQLQPVSAGGPMAAITKLCGTQRISEIRRQQVDWQRAASTDFATGQADRALEAYDRAGKLHLEANDKEARAALVRDWRADVERNSEAEMRKPWEARLVVAGRNKDVRALNEDLRKAYREAGRLKGEDVEVQAFSRGQNGKLESLKLAAGDRLIFGESVTINGVSVNNSDMATVETVQPGADPTVRLRFDKGDVVEARWSEFVGFRDEDAPDNTKHPKCQHAYAVTVHASQGTTVNKCFAYNGHGMGMESAYVAMTRHREDAAMYVDTSRIIDRLEARKAGNKLTVSSTGKTSARDAEDEDKPKSGEEITRADIAKVVLHEVMRSEQKANVSDFFEDKRAWAYGEAQPEKAEELSLPISPAYEAAEPWMVYSDGYDGLSDEMKASAEHSYAEWAKAKPELAERHDIYDYVGYVQQKEAERRADYEKATSGEVRSSLTPDMMEASLAALDDMVAAGAVAPRGPSINRSNGIVPVRKQPVEAAQETEPKPAQEASMAQGMREESKATPTTNPFSSFGRGGRTEPGRALQQRMAERQQGPAYPASQPRPAITQGIRGLSPEQELQAFCSEIDLVRFLESRGYATKEKWANGWKMQNGDMTLHVKHGGSGHTAGMWVWTRPDGSENGTIIGYMQKVERAGNLGEIRKQLRAYMGESLDGKKVEAMAPAPVRPAAPAPERTFDFPRVRQYWAMMRDGANEWLMKARGLKREVLERFGADIRTEGPGSKQNPGGACFAHRNEAGEITGYQRKGPKHAATDGRSFSQWSSGGQKLITRMGEHEKPSVVYVGETAIDLMSAYQHDGQPKGALLCALDGATTKEAIDEVAKLAMRNREARFLIAFDNDLPKERTNPHTGEVVVIRPAGERMAEEVEAAIRARAPEARIERHFPPAEFKDWNDTIRGITREQAEQQRMEAERAAEAAVKAQQEAEERQAQALRTKAAEQELQALYRALNEDQKAGMVSPEQAAAKRREIDQAAEELKAKERDAAARLKDALSQEPPTSTPGFRL